MESSILACSQFLKSKSIKAQKDWLEACIEWLTEENNVRDVIRSMLGNSISVFCFFVVSFNKVSFNFYLLDNC